MEKVVCLGNNKKTQTSQLKNHYLVVSKQQQRQQNKNQVPIYLDLAILCFNQRQVEYLEAKKQSKQHLLLLQRLQKQKLRKSLRLLKVDYLEENLQNQLTSFNHLQLRFLVYSQISQHNRYLVVYQQDLFLVLRSQEVCLVRQERVFLKVPLFSKNKMQTRRKRKKNIQVMKLKKEKRVLRSTLILIKLIFSRLLVKRSKRILLRVYLIKK